MEIHHSLSGLSEQLVRMLGYLKQDPQNIFLALDVFDLSLDEDEGLAQKVISAAEKIAPLDPRLRSRQAALALRRGVPQEAVAHLEALGAACSEDRGLRYNLAYAYYLSGAYLQARDVLRAFADKETWIPGAAALYALSIQQTGDIEAAIGFAEQHLAVQNDEELMGVLALLYFDAERDLELIRSMAQAAMTAIPDHPMALIAAGGVALREEKPEPAIAMYRSVVERNPEDGRAWSSLGVAYLFQQDAIAARDALLHALEHMPAHIGTWHALAWSQLMLKDTAGAEASYLRAEALDRNFGETLGGLAVTAYLSGDKVRSKTLMQRAKRLAPGGMTLLYLKLLELQEAGEHDAAEAFLYRTVAAIPGFNGDSVVDVMRRMSARIPASPVSAI